jgi:hypothetical protein
MKSTRRQKSRKVRHSRKKHSLRKHKDGAETTAVKWLTEIFQKIKTTITNKLKDSKTTANQRIAIKKIQKEIENLEKYFKSVDSKDAAHYTSEISKRVDTEMNLNRDKIVNIKLEKLKILEEKVKLLDKKNTNLTKLQEEIKQLQEYVQKNSKENIEKEYDDKIKDIQKKRNDDFNKDIQKLNDDLKKIFSEKFSQLKEKEEQLELFIAELDKSIVTDKENKEEMKKKFKEKIKEYIKEYINTKILRRPATSKPEELAESVELKPTNDDKDKGPEKSIELVKTEDGSKRRSKIRSKRRSKRNSKRRSKRRSKRY